MGFRGIMYGMLSCVVFWGVVYLAVRWLYG